MSSSRLHYLNQDDTFKATKTDIIFTITNKIVPVIYWHQLRKKMLEFLQDNTPPEEKKNILATPENSTRKLSTEKIEESPPPSPPPDEARDKQRTISDEQSARYKNLFANFAKKTTTPEAFLNYFKTMHYNATEKFIEDFLLYLLAQEKNLDKSTLSQSDTALYLGLQTYFQGPAEIDPARSTKKEVSSPEQKITQLKEVFDENKSSNPLLISINSNVTALGIKNTDLETQAGAIHKDFLQLRNKRRDALSTALANQLGFHLRSAHSPPTTLAAVGKPHRKYFKELVKHHEQKPSSKNHWPARLVKVIHSKIENQHADHFAVLIKLKESISNRDEKDTIDLRSICKGPDQAIVDFWFPSSFTSSLPTTRQDSLALIASIEENLLLSLENSPFIENNVLAQDDYYTITIIECNKIKNKIVKELLLKLIRTDIHSFNINSENVGIFLQRLFVITNHITAYLSKSPPSSDNPTDPAGIKFFIEDIQQLFPPPNGSPAVLYFDRLLVRINHELNTSEPLFEKNDIIDDKDKKIVSFSPKTTGANAGTDVTIMTGQSYTIKQGNRTYLPFRTTEISIANTLAEVAAAIRMQKMTLAPKTIAPGCYLIKKPRDDEEKKEEKREENPLPPQAIAAKVVEGLQKNFYVASEWSTDYLSIKACALFGFPSRQYMAGTRQPELFEALRELNAQLGLELEDVFHAGATVVDFDEHFENFLLKFDIETLHDRSNQTYALYLINHLKQFISQYQLTAATKPIYVAELVAQIKKIQKLGARVYFHKIDHDSGFYRYCDYTKRTIDLSAHRTSWYHYSRRWGLTTEPTSHLTEMLVGRNPDLLLLSRRSIAIMKAHPIAATLEQTEQGLKDYFIEINKVAASKTLYGQKEQIRFVLLDQFYAHITGGEAVPLPESFADVNEEKLKEHNDCLEAKMCYKIKNAAIHRTYDLQYQFQQIVENASQPQNIARMHPYNLQQQNIQRTQYLKFKSFLTQDMLDNRAELLFHSWQEITAEYKKKKRHSNSSATSLGLQTRVNTLYQTLTQELKKGGNASPHTIKALKLQAYLETERYLQANHLRFRSRTLANTILAVTGNSKKRPFFRNTDITSVDPLKKDELLYSLSYDLEKINLITQGGPYLLSNIYHNFLNIMQTLHAINQLGIQSTQNNQFSDKLAEIYKNFQGAYRDSGAFDVPLSALIHLLSPTIEMTSTDDISLLIGHLNDALSQCMLIKNLKQQVYNEKITVLNEVLPQIKLTYQKQIGFFQSTASRKLFAKLNSASPADEKTYEMITQYFSIDKNRNRALGQTIIHCTRWYHPADVKSYQALDKKRESKLS